MIGDPLRETRTSVMTEVNESSPPHKNHMQKLTTPWKSPRSHYNANANYNPDTNSLTLILTLDHDRPWQVFVLILSLTHNVRSWTSALSALQSAAINDDDSCLYSIKPSATAICVHLPSSTRGRNTTRRRKQTIYQHITFAASWPLTLWSCQATLSRDCRSRAVLSAVIWVIFTGVSGE